MLILIGQPSWRNGTEDLLVANMEVTVEIAIGENPKIWRAESGWKIVALDAAELVTERLQGLRVAGFKPLSVTNGVPVDDKKRQIFQVDAGTKWIVHPTQ